MKRVITSGVEYKGRDYTQSKYLIEDIHQDLLDYLPMLMDLFDALSVLQNNIGGNVGLYIEKAQTNIDAVRKNIHSIDTELDELFG